MTGAPGTSGEVVQQALVRAQAHGGAPVVTLAYPGAAPELMNEYCLFLKPELTDEAARLPERLQVVLDALARTGQEVVATSVLSSDYLGRHEIMRRHYGIIDRISRGGQAALSEEARKKLKESFSEDIAAGALVLGGEQFLAQHAEFTAEKLAELFDSLPLNKVGSGAYAGRAKIGEQVVILLNGFQPAQLERFTAPGRGIVVFAVRTKTSWKTLRREFTGATNPTQAVAGSLRAEFLRRKDELDLKEVSTGLNAVHVSAGPVEGMVELARYFSDLDGTYRLDVTATTFGAGALRAGLGTERLSAAAANTVVTSAGRGGPVFDLTEELDANEAVALLRDAV